MFLFTRTSFFLYEYNFYIRFMFANYTITVKKVSPIVYIKKFLVEYISLATFFLFPYIYYTKTAESTCMLC